MLKKLLKFLPSSPVYAHCDIPCGIYDPHQMQVAAHTVIRMTNMLLDLKGGDDMPFEERRKVIHQIVRLTKVKEEHAEIVKREVVVLWGDYFKKEHFEQYTELHSMVLRALKQASHTKQELSLEAAQELLGTVQEIAEIFYKTKGVKPVRVKSIFPTEGEIVVYK